MSPFEKLRLGYSITEVLFELGTSPTEVSEFILAFENYFGLKLTEVDLAYLRKNVPLLSRHSGIYYDDPIAKKHILCPFFVDLLYHEEPRVQVAAIDWLKTFKHKRALQNLRDLILSDNSDIVVNSAMSAIVALDGGSEENIFTLIDGLDHPSWLVRGNAASLLQSLGAKAEDALFKLNQMYSNIDETASNRHKAGLALKEIWRALTN